MIGCQRKWINKSVVRDAETSNYSNSLKGTISMSIYTLYIKTHNKTGLKYLGQTSKQDPYKYAGSGTYWLRHLDKHGYDYTTEILKECHSKEELKTWGLYYSNLWNVVENEEWANLQPERGDGGNGAKPGRIVSEETKIKISNSLKGRILGPRSDETKLKLSKAHKGKKGSEYQKQRMKEVHTGKIVSEETRLKQSKALKGKSLEDLHGPIKAAELKAKRSMPRKLKS